MPWASAYLSIQEGQAGACGCIMGQVQGRVLRPTGHTGHHGTPQHSHPLWCSACWSRCPHTPLLNWCSGQEWRCAFFAVTWLARLHFHYLQERILSGYICLSTLLCHTSGVPTHFKLALTFHSCQSSPLYKTSIYTSTSICNAAIHILMGADTIYVRLGCMHTPFLCHFIRFIAYSARANM